YFHKTGRVVWILLAVTLVRDAAGRPMHFVAQIMDITARREAGQRVKASLEEKEVLLREIHHRVKNNMQIVSSLLQLQSAYVTDAGTLRMFAECADRIKSMALIHEKLYMSRDLAAIDFGAYVESLVA